MDELGWDWFLGRCDEWWTWNGIRAATRASWLTQVRDGLTDADDPIYRHAVEHWEEPWRFATSWMRQRVADPRPTIAWMAMSTVLVVSGLLGVVTPDGAGLTFATLVALIVGGAQISAWGIGAWSRARAWTLGVQGCVGGVVLLVCARVIGARWLDRITDGVNARLLAASVATAGAIGLLAARQSDPRRLAR